MMNPDLHRRPEGEASRIAPDTEAASGAIHASLASRSGQMALTVIRAMSRPPQRRYGVAAVVLVIVLAIAAGLVSLSGPRYVRSGDLVQYETLAELVSPNTVVAIGTFDSTTELINIGPLEVDPFPSGALPESYVLMREFHVKAMVHGQPAESLRVAQRVHGGTRGRLIGMDHAIFDPERTYLVVAGKSDNGDYWWVGPQRAFIVIGDRVYSRDIYGEVDRAATIHVDGWSLDEFIAELLGPTNGN